MISAALVQKLREKTGVGMMQCKKALENVNGDFEAAVDFLRKQGLEAAGKKSDRVTAQGLVSISKRDDHKSAAIIEVRCETDFVAMNQNFQQLVQKMTDHCARYSSLEEVLSSSIDGSSVSDFISSNIAVIGEKIELAKFEQLTINDGIIASYVHNATTNNPNMGAIGILVAIKTDSNNNQRLLEVGRQIAMHIAASDPRSATIEELDPKIVAREKEILIEQAKNSGKPEEVALKMVEGRLKKFYQEFVLLEQNFIMDNTLSVRNFLETIKQELGANRLEIIRFIRYHIG
ncbi:Elongation factor Ts [Rickettsiales endosymbiont of Paramecium tredecaurelia]|uniref:translation elongation factor Ts n=1 Tax=Candidatus Sarmatiella mevalonica TaxID=2770581 RepID=UPI00192252C5|nr:translation elongation factor Ts [Candidatus Sarmatiella mevalonica]MBL3284639.1 Elongation factor Ts [Candidatus Sarmatiella mevalonica]